MAFLPFTSATGRNLAATHGFEALRGPARPEKTPLVDDQRRSAGTEPNDPSVAWDLSTSTAPSETFAEPDAMADQHPRTPAGTLRHSADAPPALQSGTSRRWGDRSRASQAERFFPLMKRWGDEGTLTRYVVRDSAGRENFDINGILQAAQQQGVTVSRENLRNLLGHLIPSQVETLLKRRQWLQPLPSKQELRGQLLQLATEIPYLAFASRSRMAHWINERHPNFFCSMDSVLRCMAPVSHDETAVVRAVDGMIKNRKIDLYFNPGMKYGVDQRSLLDQLRLQGIGVSARGLDRVLRARKRQLAFAPGEFACIQYVNGSDGKYVAGQEMAKALGLRAGDPMPPWPTFMAAFTQCFCQADGRAAPRKIAGGPVMAVYVALERFLRDTASGVQGSAATKRAHPSADPHEEPAVLDLSLKRARADRPHSPQ